MPDVRLDVFNKVCPMPAAMTRIEVLKLEKGQIIEIEGDCSFATANVIRMVEKYGAELLEQETGKDYFRSRAVKQ